MCACIKILMNFKNGMQMFEVQGLTTRSKFDCHLEGAPSARVWEILIWLIYGINDGDNLKIRRISNRRDGGGEKRKKRTKFQSSFVEFFFVVTKKRRRLTVVNYPWLSKAIELIWRRMLYKNVFPPPLLDSFESQRVAVLSNPKIEFWIEPKLAMLGNTLEAKCAPFA